MATEVSSAWAAAAATGAWPQADQSAQPGAATWGQAEPQYTQEQLMQYQQQQMLLHQQQMQQMGLPQMQPQAAAEPAWNGQGAGGGGGPGGPYTGTVKSFNPEKGWGFIACDETFAVFGADCFLLKSQLQGATCGKGDAVSFFAQKSEKGIEAKNVTVTQSASGGAWGQAATGWPLAPPAAGGAGAPSEQVFWGTVKSFSMEKGWGFLACDAARQIVGKDVFVNKAAFQGVAPPIGAQVQFTAEMKEKGLQANWVQVVGVGVGGWGGGGGGVAAGWGAPPVWGAAAASAAWGGGAPAWGASPAAPPGSQVDENQTFYGTVKTINEEKGWGHIKCDKLHKTFSKDMFVMKSNLEGLGLFVGQTVVFNVANGAKGPHARNIRQFEVSSEVYSGSVKVFNADKGWGFFESEAAKQAFGSDIFFHKNDLNECQVVAGTQASFSVDVSGGRPQAKNIMVFGEYGAAPAQPSHARPAPY